MCSPALGEAPLGPLAQTSGHCPVIYLCCHSFQLPELPPEATVCFLVQVTIRALPGPRLLHLVGKLPLTESEGKCGAHPVDFPFSGIVAENGASFMLLSFTAGYIGRSATTLS